VKGVFPNVNPSFDNSNFSASMKMFNMDKLEAAGLSVRLVDRMVTTALGQRWL